MLSQKKSQGMSINVMIIAVIGLIILLVLMAILTGRTSIFTRSSEDASSCQSACRAIESGMSKSVYTSSGSCVDTSTTWYQIVPGKFDDVTGTNSVCCCFKPK